MDKTRDNQTENKKKFMGVMPPKEVRVLIVDDDEDILELLRLSLSHEGYKIQTTSDARESLRLLDEFSPDLMCIDYLMPGLNGQELARQIRARQDMLYVPIVMLTGTKEEPSAKLSSLDSGVDAYLTKPISGKELKVTIRALLRVKLAQDKMLEALERVAEVQDELLEYERQQGQYEAMQATIATFSHELAGPLQAAQAAAARLSTDTGDQQRGELKQIQTALGLAQVVIERLNATTEFSTKEILGNQVLDLD